MGSSQQTLPIFTFACVSCRDDQVAGQPAAIILDHSVCQECFDGGLRPQFEAYLKDESSPVMWAGQSVSFDAVRHQFSDEFTQKFLERLQEYDVNPRQRIHCKCEKFLGKKTTSKASVTCSSCAERTCTHCSATIDNIFFETHTCTEKQADDAFQGLQIGRDWQKCPKCETPVNLREACNHMTCPMTVCRTHFCYICGVEAHPDDGTHHWGVGRPCPLYGQQHPRPVEPDLVPVPAPLNEDDPALQRDRHNLAMMEQEVRNEAERLQLEELRRRLLGAHQRLANLRAERARLEADL